jgi:alkylglycerol monooxygenase
LVGFPASMITGMLLVHGLYPFFIHTRLIGRLGVLEYILVTPSHHRVHHGSNEKYLDKNYGDVFIIWDKLFGTFQKEEDEPVYGLTHPLRTYSFLWQHFHYFIEIAIAMKRQKSIQQKISVLFGSPARLDATARAEAEKIFNVKQSSQPMGEPLNQYVLWQVVFLLVSLFIFILLERNLSIAFIISFTAFTILTLINCGAVMEQKRWVFDVEFLRLISLSIVPIYDGGYIAAIIILLLIPVIFIYYQWLKEEYLALVYNNKFS